MEPVDRQRVTRGATSAPIMEPTPPDPRIMAAYGIRKISGFLEKGSAPEFSIRNRIAKTFGLIMTK